MSGTHIDLDEIFRAVVAKYDEISPILVANNFPMEMVRARLKPDLRTKIEIPTALMRLDSTQISGHEGHCLNDAIPLLKGLLNQYDPNQINGILSHLADQFNKRGGLADSHTGFRQVNEYLSWHARLLFSKRLGIELNTKPDLKPLERHLGIAQ